MELDVAILGAGAAGMMAAVAVGEVAKGLRVGIFEKNVRPGIKVLVCGGGRCNFTNAGSVEFLIEQFGRNGRFLTPALLHLDNDALRAWFERERVPSHEEHDGKVYPDSNQARSVVDALVRRMREQGVEILCGAAGTVTGVEKSGEGFRIVTGDGVEHVAKVVVIAVGGMSYQKMGTTGDGYGFAESLGAQGGHAAAGDCGAAGAGGMGEGVAGFGGEGGGGADCGERAVAGVGDGEAGAFGE